MFQYLYREGSLRAIHGWLSHHCCQPRVLLQSLLIVPSALWESLRIRSAARESLHRAARHRTATKTATASSSLMVCIWLQHMVTLYAVDEPALGVPFKLHKPTQSRRRGINCDDKNCLSKVNVHCVSKEESTLTIHAQTIVIRQRGIRPPCGCRTAEGHSAMTAHIGSSIAPQQGTTPVAREAQPARTRSFAISNVPPIARQSPSTLGFHWPWKRSQAASQ